MALSFEPRLLSTFHFGGLAKRQSDFGKSKTSLFNFMLCSFAVSIPNLPFRHSSLKNEVLSRAFLFVHDLKLSRMHGDPFFCVCQICTGKIL
jgi:hypothetical protein